MLPARKLLPVLAIIGLILPSGSVAAADPGCAAGEVRVVSHSWWQQKGEAFPGRHIHMATCFPRHAVLSGTLHLDLDITLHNQPGTITKLRIQAWPQLDPAWQKTVSMSCPTSECVFHVPADINLGSATGWTEFRLTANISSNVFGQRQYESTRFPACLRTCSGGYASHRDGAAGWYLGSYQNAYVSSSFVDKVQAGPITPGTTFQAKGDRNRMIVAIDANSHANDSGIVLGTTTSHDWKTYTIPNLPSGWHRLYVRTEQDFSTGMSAGQYELWFYVP